jgi:hypothetical protein
LAIQVVKTETDSNAAMNFLSSEQKKQFAAIVFFLLKQKENGSD